MIVRLISFTERGQALAIKIAEALEGEATRCNQPLTLSEWTEMAFEEADALVFVGAAGIAVRAIAPHVRSKAHDPAVVVIDERACFSIPLLSGHLGGANELARRIAKLTGALPAVTTATDVNGVFAFDDWARIMDCVIPHPERIKLISARLLAGDTVKLYSEFAVGGDLPEGIVLASVEDCDVYLGIRLAERPVLTLIPRILALGVGCRRGISMDALENAFDQVMSANRIAPEAVRCIGTIDLKRDEAALIAFSRKRGWPMQFYSAAELSAAKGVFSASDFVRQVTGVDNVCERSAVLAVGGKLVVPKSKADGVTMALAAAPFRPKWSTQANEP